MGLRVDCLEYLCTYRYAYMILGGRDRAYFLRTSKPFVEPVLPLGNKSPT